MVNGGLMRSYEAAMQQEHVSGYGTCIRLTDDELTQSARLDVGVYGTGELPVDRLDCSFLEH